MNFYLLWEKSDKKALYKNAGEDSNIRKCDECRGVRSILKKPLKIQLRDKETSDFYKVRYDVIGGGIQDILIRHNFKGFKLSPIEIEVKNEERLLDKELYKLARIDATGKGGFLHDLLGNKIPCCEKCGRIKILRNHKGISVNEKEWDGSDIFYFNNWYGNLIITEDVYKILNESNTQNVRFINLKEFVF